MYVYLRKPIVFFARNVAKILSIFFQGPFGGGGSCCGHGCPQAAVPSLAVKFRAQVDEQPEQAAPAEVPPEQGQAQPKPEAQPVEAPQQNREQGVFWSLWGNRGQGSCCGHGCSQRLFLLR